MPDTAIPGRSASVTVTMPGGTVSTGEQAPTGTSTVAAPTVKRKTPVTDGVSATLQISTNPVSGVCRAETAAGIPTRARTPAAVRPAIHSRRSRGRRIAAHGPVLLSHCVTPPAARSLELARVRILSDSGKPVKDPIDDIDARS